MEDAILVQARIHVSSDRRGDSCHGPAFPDRPDTGALLDPAGESDQRIPEVAFELLARRFALRNGESEGRSHSFLQFGCMTVGAGLDATDRQFSHGAVPGLHAPASGTRPGSLRSRA